MNDKAEPKVGQRITTVHDGKVGTVMGKPVGRSVPVQFAGERNGRTADIRQIAPIHEATFQRIVHKLLGG